MLQPQSYPELVARALVLDEEPYAVMADDDNPWVEGLALVTLLSLLAGAALALGSLLTAMALPDPNTLQTTILDGWNQIAGALNLPSTAVDLFFRRIWPLLTTLTGYAGGWTHLAPLIMTTFVAVVGWLFFGLVAFVVARALGGKGRLSGTLGASALMVSPTVFLWFTIVPFAAVSGVLLAVWGVLIGYRAVEVAHHLTWQKAALTTIITYAAALVFLVAIGAAFSVGYTAGGYR